MSLKTYDSTSEPCAEFVTSTCATFTLKEQDHTLGNSLRAILSANPEVEFAGYSIPHPTQPELNIRIQTYKKPAVTVLINSLEELYHLGNHIKTTFDEAVSSCHIKK